MKKLLYILLGIVILLVIAIFAVNEDYHFEKSVTINAPAEKIYPHISSMKSFNEWNPWLKMDPKLKMEYTGTSGTVGDKYCWKSEDQSVGNGCQEITALVPNQKQSTKMVFEGMGDAYSDIVLSPQGNATKVTWTLDSKLERPKNLMKFIMNGAMDKSYGDGLAKLKEISEK